MKKTNLTYVKKSYGVNPKKNFVKCVLDYEINLDKIPGIQTLALMPGFEDFINKLVYRYDVPCYDTDVEGFPSDYGVLVFTTEAVANCAPGDEFNEETGKKLALTRAQKQAFRTARDLYASLFKLVDDEFCGLMGLIYGSDMSADKCKAHEHEITGHVVDSYSE